MAKSKSILNIYLVEKEICYGLHKYVRQVCKRRHFEQFTKFPTVQLQTRERFTSLTFFSTFFTVS